MGMGPVMQQLKAKLKTTPVFTTPPDVEYTQNPIGLTPFIRENDINFSAKSLKPDTNANFFFDEILVNNKSQLCTNSLLIYNSNSIIFIKNTY
jgi:hypothetical protein